MLAEVLHIFRMYQILLPCVFVVVFLKVMYLILILIVTVMAGSETKVRKFDTILRFLEEGFSRDPTRLYEIE